MVEEKYIGSELEIFAKAEKWKSYFSRFISPYLGADVLEVGAGLGATTEVLCKGEHHRWLCLEPDGTLLAEIDEKVAAGSLPVFCRSQKGSINDLNESARFDTILYIDVLEHIEKDAQELARANKHLRAGGKLIVLSPAYEKLYSPFDKEIGHFRRYDKKSLAALTPSKSKIDKMIYLDALGVLLSFANRLLLRQHTPTDRQIQFWDKRIIPLSRFLDPLVGYRAGRSVLGIWEKTK